MKKDFEYFFWSTPESGEELFALYDLFDNHLMMQSFSYDYLFTIRTLFKSKTMLDVVNLSKIENLVEHNLIDNSVVENWGIKSPATDMYTDARPRWAGHSDAEAYRKHTENNVVELIEVDSNFDEFKRDLQKQIFFAHFCLTIEPTELVLSHLHTAIGLGIDYEDTVDKFVNLTNIVDRQTRVEMLHFLKKSNLFYE